MTTFWIDSYLYPTDGSLPEAGTGPAEEAGPVPPAAAKDGDLAAWAASMALKGIEKVKERVSAIASRKTDPAKLYEEVRAHLEEGNLPAAKRKMMLFKKWTEGTSDLKLSKMREEIRTVLRELNFAAVEDLKKANETLLEQRLSHLDLVTPHFVHEKMAEKNGRALDLLMKLIEKGSVDSIKEGLRIVKPLMADDADLMRLIELETRDGLRGIDTPDKLKRSSLEVAKELRHRDGSYLIAEEKLKTVLAEEIREAMASITPDEAKAVKDEVYHKIYLYNRVREKAVEAMSKLKKEDPEKFKEEYPESFRRGYLYEDELKREMNEIYAVLVEAAKENFALKRIGEKYEAGKMLDPVAREAWLTLDRMKDPADAWLEMSDATWDRLIDEAVIMAVTGVAAAGAGSVTRFGMGALTRSLTARGGAWALAARGTTFAATTAAESLAMEGVNYAVTKEFDPKNLAFNALTSLIFHGGPALARGLGFVDEAAEGLAARAKNLTGTLAVQTLLDTGVGYLHDATIGHGDERTLWERLFQGALRMGGFHAVGVLTGHATTRMEILSKVRDDAAAVRFRWLKERGYTNGESASLAAKYAKGINFETARAILEEIRKMRAVSKTKIIDIEASAGTIERPAAKAAEKPKPAVGKGEKPAPEKGRPDRDLIAASATLVGSAVAVYAEPALAAVAAARESLGHWGPAASLGLGAGLFAVGGIFSRWGSWLGRRLSRFFSRGPATPETPSHPSPPIDSLSVEMGPYRTPAATPSERGSAFEPEAFPIVHVIRLDPMEPMCELDLASIEGRILELVPGLRNERFREARWVLADRILAKLLRMDAADISNLTILRSGREYRGVNALIVLEVEEISRDSEGGSGEHNRGGGPDHGGGGALAAVGPLMVFGGHDSVHHADWISHAAEAVGDMVFTAGAHAYNALSSVAGDGSSHGLLAVLAVGAVAVGLPVLAKYLRSRSGKAEKGIETFRKEIDDLLATSPRVPGTAREAIRKELLAEALRTGRIPTRVDDILPRILEALRADGSKKPKTVEKTESVATVALRDEDIVMSDTEVLPAAARRAITLPERPISLGAYRKGPSPSSGTFHAARIRLNAIRAKIEKGVLNASDPAVLKEIEKCESMLGKYGSDPAKGVETRPELHARSLFAGWKNRLLDGYEAMLAEFGRKKGLTLRSSDEKTLTDGRAYVKYELAKEGDGSEPVLILERVIDEKTRSVDLYNIEVSEARRGAGIGKAVFRDLEPALMRKLGVAYVRAHFLNPVAKRLFTDGYGTSRIDARLDHLVAWPNGRIEEISPSFDLLGIEYLRFKSEPLPSHHSAERPKAALAAVMQAR